MTLSNQDLLQKAFVGIQSTTGASADFGNTTGGLGISGQQAPLSIEQATEFLRLAITPQAILPDVRTVMSNAAKWQESKIDFASRVLKPGSEGEELATGDRTKPTTGMVEISTVLVRGDVPISDETFEDQVEGQGFGDTVINLLTQAVGRDLEDLFMNGDTNNSVVGHDGTAYMQLLDGWIKKAATGTGANVVDAVSMGQDYQGIMKTMLLTLADKYKRDLDNMRFYVPRRLHELYVDILSKRGTPLGDFFLEGTRDIRYQGILMKPVPLSNIVAGSPDKAFILLSHRMNLIAGYRRAIRMESWRYPPAGNTRYLVNARVDAQIEHIPATVVAKNVDVEPS